MRLSADTVTNITWLKSTSVDTWQSRNNSRTFTNNVSPLGYTLRLIRKEKKLTLNQLAKISHASRSEIQRIENGLYPKITTLCKIVDALDMEPPEIQFTDEK